MKNIMMIAMLFLSITYAEATEVVVDNKTKLEWQNEALNKTQTESWQGAIDYCEGLTLDEKDDWRLPNINELQSLADYNKPSRAPAIVSTLEDTTIASIYWSSTTYVKDTKTVFVLSFVGGFSFNENKASNEYYVRCVRG